MNDGLMKLALAFINKVLCFRKLIVIQAAPVPYPIFVATEIPSLSDGILHLVQLLALVFASHKLALKSRNPPVPIVKQGPSISQLLVELDVLGKGGSRFLVFADVRECVAKLLMKS